MAGEQSSQLGVDVTFLARGIAIISLKCGVIYICLFTIYCRIQELRLLADIDGRHVSTQTHGMKVTCIQGLHRHMVCVTHDRTKRVTCTQVSH